MSRLGSARRPPARSVQRRTPILPVPAGAGAGALREAGEAGRPLAEDAPAPPRLYTAQIDLDPASPCRDMGRIAEEVLAHLAALPGAEVRLTLAVRATLPEGAPEDVRRTVTENGHTLRFRAQDFGAG